MKQTEIKLSAEAFALFDLDMNYKLEQLERDMSRFERKIKSKHLQDKLNSLKRRKS